MLYLFVLDIYVVFVEDHNSYYYCKGILCYFESSILYGIAPISCHHLYFGCLSMLYSLFLPK